MHLCVRYNKTRTIHHSRSTIALPPPTPTALQAAAGGSAAAVRRLYEALLSRRGTAGGGGAMEAQLCTLRMKAQLLRCAVRACVCLPVCVCAEFGPGNAKPWACGKKHAP